jgi:hypothetical protein
VRTAKVSRRSTIVFAESEENPVEKAKGKATEAADAVQQAVEEAAGDVKKAVPDDAPAGFDKVKARRGASKGRTEEYDQTHVRNVQHHAL